MGLLILGGGSGVCLVVLAGGEFLEERIDRQARRFLRFARQTSAHGRAGHTQLDEKFEQCLLGVLPGEFADDLVDGVHVLDARGE